MALPETNISVSLIKNTIGESTTGIAALRTSQKNNWWGFSSLIRGWGDRNPTAPYKMGDYRDYDHYFRCWSFSAGFQNATNFEDPMELGFELLWFPTWSLSDTSNHTFDILFKRTNDFQQGGYTTVQSNVILSNQTQYTFYINRLSPPDGGADLTENEIFYVAFLHTSDDGLTWDENEAVSSPDGQILGDNFWVFQAQVPDDPYTYNLTLSSVTSYMYIVDASTKGIVGTIYLTIDTRADIYTTVEVQYCKSSSFDVDVQSLNLSDTLLANTTSPGTPVQRTINISGTPNNYFSVNDTVYYRARIISAINGTVYYNSNWSSIYSLTVTKTLPT